jgi:hypothetical protein
LWWRRRFRYSNNKVQVSIIMASTIKVNNIQNQCGANIANKCGSTITLGASGDTITLACGASQTGFGRTGTVDWDTTAKTASFTAVSGEGYFCNTTSSAFTATLPAGSAGAIVSLADYAGTWQTNNLTVSPDGTDKIGGVNGSVTLNTEGQSVTFVYIDSTQGWINTMDSTSNVRASAFISATGGTETTCGDYKIHTFTGPGTFTVSATAACAADNNVDYLVVAGGGGASGGQAGAGGAGGFRESSGAASGCYSASPLGACVSALPVTVTGYPITVGAGGSTCSCNSIDGVPGSNSIFSSITSTGGGGGAKKSGSPAPSGLSGGSAGGNAACGPATAGAGNTPPVSPPQGQPGGSTPPVVGDGGAAGGGGALNAGSPAVNRCAPGGPGGDGAQTSINGSATYYAGGGAAGNGGNTPNPAPSKLGGDGGLGGGGDGGDIGTSAQSGTANTGGGGGAIGNGSGGQTSGSGGSGIVIIRYKYQ